MTRFLWVYCKMGEKSESTLNSVCLVLLLLGGYFQAGFWFVRSVYRNPVWNWQVSFHLNCWRGSDVPLNKTSVVQAFGHSGILHRRRLKMWAWACRKMPVTDAAAVAMNTWHLKFVELTKIFLYEVQHYTGCRKSGPQVWKVLFLLSLTISAWVCLQNSLATYS